ncbi:hypothetical protein [Nocardioides sp.]|uniref:hypothetical protein n=1 Tax=Nocardioides sp. TaxID=35761 RepID=UPI0035B3451B
MDEPRTSTRPDPGAGCYIIRIQGRLEHRWSAWFDGMTLTPETDGTTVLRGAVSDQAALHGLIQKVRDLGLTLLEVTLEDDAACPGSTSEPQP